MNPSKIFLILFFVRNLNQTQTWIFDIISTCEKVEDEDSPGQYKLLYTSNAYYDVIEEIATQENSQNLYEKGDNKILSKTDNKLQYKPLGTCIPTVPNAY